MSAAVAFVLTIATIVTFLIQKFVLDVFGLGYLQTITFILVIAGLVQMVEIILKKRCLRLCIRLWVCSCRFDYNELLYSWCRYPGDSERL